MTEARRMTEKEHQQGWYLMACSCCAYIWKSDVLHQLRKIGIEPLDHMKVSCDGSPGTLSTELLEKLENPE